MTLENVLQIHDGLIDLHGGLHGIRDKGLLISAIEMPRTCMFGEYLHKTLFDKAAAYIFHIVCNHPFLDGNKRTGASSALIFLDMNKFNHNFTKDPFDEMVRNVARGKLNKEQISKFLEQNKE